jgi:hypothetical protein
VREPDFDYRDHKLVLMQVSMDGGKSYIPALVCYGCHDLMHTDKPLLEGDTKQYA